MVLGRYRNPYFTSRWKDIYVYYSVEPFSDTNPGTQCGGELKYDNLKCKLPNQSILLDLQFP